MSEEGLFSNEGPLKPQVSVSDLPATDLRSVTNEVEAIITNRQRFLIENTQVALLDFNRGLVQIPERFDKLLKIPLPEDNVNLFGQKDLIIRSREIESAYNLSSQDDLNLRGLRLLDEQIAKTKADFTKAAKPKNGRPHKKDLRIYKRSKVELDAIRTISVGAIAAVKILNQVKVFAINHDNPTKALKCLLSHYLYGQSCIEGADTQTTALALPFGANIEKLEQAEQELRDTKKLPPNNKYFLDSAKSSDISELLKTLYQSANHTGDFGQFEEQLTSRKVTLQANFVDNWPELGEMIRKLLPKQAQEGSLRQQLSARGER